MRKIKTILLMVLSMVTSYLSATGQEQAVTPAGQYKPVTLIEGKWGTGTEEFGSVIFYVRHKGLDDTEEFRYGPGSLAVNSQYEVYLLDTVNNRIKKYNDKGKLLRNIEVSSLLNWNKTVIHDEEVIEGKPFYEGVNIACDSKDNLYYYFIKGNKGMVLQFQNDNLSNQWTIPVINRLFGSLYIDGDDNVLVFAPYNKENASYDVFKSTFVSEYWDTAKGNNIIIRSDIRNKVSCDVKLKIIDRKNNKILKELVYSGREKNGNAYALPLVRGKNIFVVHYLIPNTKNEVFIDKYTEDGRLLSNSYLKDEDSNVNLKNLVIDMLGNIYKPASTEDTFEVIKWER